MNFPPDDWAERDGDYGTWGTDIVSDSTTHKTGGYSVKFITTTGASPKPSIISESFIPVRSSTDYMGEIELQADANAAGQVIGFLVAWYDKDKAAISSSDIRALTVVAATSTWETTRTIVTSPPTARYAKLAIQAQSTGATASFNAYVDSVRFVQAIPSWRIYNAGTWSHTSSGSYLTFPYDTTTGSHATLIGVTESSGVITIVDPGLYTFGAAVYTTGLANGKFIHCKVIINGTSADYPAFGNIGINSTGGSASVASVAHGQHYMNAGETLEVEVIQDSGGTQSILGGWNFGFYGALVER